MAAATQYASVPGIAVDQPVMYETVEREEQEESSSADWGDKEVGSGPCTKDTTAQWFARLRCKSLLRNLDYLTKSVRKTGHIEGSNCNMQVWDLSRQLERRQIVGKDGDSSDIKVTVKKKFSHGHQVVQWREKQKMSMAR